MKIIFFLLLVFASKLFSQVKEIKQELEIQFPNSTLEKKENPTIIQNKDLPKQDSILIPFPKDETEKIKQKEIEFSELIKKDNSISNKTDLPLEKLLVIPQVDLSNPKKTDENIDSIEKKSSQKKELTTEDSSFKKTITENKPKEISTPKNTKDTIDKSVKDVRSTSKLFINKENEIKPKETDTKKVSLPNQDAKSKSKKTILKEDDSIPPFERSKYQKNRNDVQAALPDLNTSINASGVMSNSAKMDQIRLYAIDRKKQEANALIETIDDPIFKYKGLYELAIGLENSAKNNKKLKEESIPFLLKIITEAPKDNPILPKSLWAISHLHYTLGEHTAALDHLSNIILNHKSSEFIDDAVYLSARIYEESTSIRNLNRAKKYYSMFMQNIDKPNFKNSLYLPFVKSRIESLKID